MSPNSIYGDKYDPISGKYLDKYRQGAHYKGLEENREVYVIALRVSRILKLTQTEKGRRIFYKLLRKYNKNLGYNHRNKQKNTQDYVDEIIEVYISRPDGYLSRYQNINEDINDGYRLYDYPDKKTRAIKPGTISRINAFSPDLVVSLHLTGGNPAKYGGLAAVITPSFSTYKTAIDYVLGGKKQRRRIKKKFNRNSYSNWFSSGCGKKSFEWFMCDAWVYFTGYWSTPDGLHTFKEKHRGPRYNMVTWPYADLEWAGSGGGLKIDTLKPGMENARGPYSVDLRSFRAEGLFWQREQSEPEKWRREGGFEGYGGDNFYASNELLRYVRQGLLVNHVRKKKTLPELQDPYISTWSVPTFVNAISAYLELGYLNNRYDYQRIKSLKKVQAEAIAVGIYSLFYGLKQNKSNKKFDLPWGHKLRLNRYRTYKSGNYFEMSKSKVLPAE